MNTQPDFWLTRLVFQRGLGTVYLIAFLVALNQFRPLLGDRGLLPVKDFVRQVPFLESPSLFYLCSKDTAFLAASWLGLLLSFLAVTGLADRFSLGISMSLWAGLWILYLSFVNVGQIFYGFGWESILLEAGFYAIFLGPAAMAPPNILIWLLRWLLFRVMFGAGLIKLRGDSCWRDLTCLDYHYETQPMPNPLSWYLHWAPVWTHRAGVAFNHFVELLVPLGYFVPGPVSAVAGLFTMVYQGLIMAGGNLSFLNFLTIILSVPALNDRCLSPLLAMEIPAVQAGGPWFEGAAIAVGILVVFLSLRPIGNMLSPRQVMNATYNPFHLVGTYGAFGSITRARYEVVIQGTDEPAVTPTTAWREYEFKGKPGDPGRCPPQIAPYHLRIDWLMWFAAMSGYERHPWFVHLMLKLLQGDAPVLGLLRTDPFSGSPPHYVRAELYAYSFTTPEERRQTGRWWKREWAGEYFPAVSLDLPAFRRSLKQVGRL